MFRLHRFLPAFAALAPAPAPAPALALALALALTLALGPGPAQAHPHVWIDAALRLVFAPDGRMQAVAVTWTFDEMYSQVSVEGLDSDGDGIPSAADLAPMIGEAMTALEEWRYFLSLRRDGHRLATGRATGAAASFSDGRLTYAFTVPLAEPAAAAGLPLDIRAFDPSFYIDITLPDGAAVTLDGAPAGCRTRLADAVPMEETLLMSEATALAAGPAPDGGDGLGGMFAQTVTLTCE